MILRNLKENVISTVDLFFYFFSDCYSKKSHSVLNNSKNKKYVHERPKLIGKLQSNCTYILCYALGHTVEISRVVDININYKQI